MTMTATEFPVCPLHGVRMVKRLTQNGHRCLQCHRGWRTRPSVDRGAPPMRSSPTCNKCGQDKTRRQTQPGWQCLPCKRGRLLLVNAPSQRGALERKCPHCGVPMIRRTTGRGWRCRPCGAARSAAARRHDVLPPDPALKRAVDPFEVECRVKEYAKRYEQLLLAFPWVDPDEPVTLPEFTLFIPEASCG